MKTHFDELVSVNVFALLDRLDAAAPGPRRLGRRQGRWFVDRWWRLIVWVVPDHRWRRSGHWQPGIYIDCRDRQGRFSTPAFVTFDECRLTPSQIDRMYAFIDCWVARRKRYEEGRQMDRERMRKSREQSVPHR